MLSRIASLALVLSFAASSWAAEPIKALCVFGGGYHDYKTQAPYITGELAKLINVKCEVKMLQKSTSELLADPKFADGYDVVVYSFCFAAEKDPALIENALKVTREGKPTVLIHCSMHTFMDSVDWTGCCGMFTRHHDRFQPFTATKACDHAITKFFPDKWQTPGDELYQTIKFGEGEATPPKGISPKETEQYPKVKFEPTGTALLKAVSPSSQKEHTICWIYKYGKGNVFGTTLGHDMKTVASPEYCKLLANGLLWSVGKLTDDGKPAEGYGK